LFDADAYLYTHPGRDAHPNTHGYTDPCPDEHRERRIIGR